MNQHKLFATEDTNEQKAVLVGVNRGLRLQLPIDDAMDELAELTKAAGAIALAQVVQNKASIEAATYIGSGKILEIKELVDSMQANMVIFNNELSGSQIRNLESAFGVRVIDRTALILDIFAQRAQSSVAKMQVELAQLKYRLPRLKGMGESMSRTAGGIGTRGPGEQQLELDRRRIHKRLSDLQNKLNAASAKRDVTKRQRQKNAIPVVALVGYTNAGKSTIMNRFINEYGDGEQTKTVFAKDMLFATLDTYHRKINIDQHKSFVLIDTVGFVSDLPHSLVEAFKATLEEVLDADLLIHVVDASNQHYDLQIDVTEKTIAQIGVKAVSQICIFNKVDLLTAEPTDIRADLYTSMATGKSFEQLVQHVDRALFRSIRTVQFSVPYNEGAVLNAIIDVGKLLETKHDQHGTIISIQLEQKHIDKYSQYLSSV